jgi:glutamine synthetase
VCFFFFNFQVSDQLEAGAKPATVAKQLLTDHWKVIFNGNGYDPEWPAQARERGIWRIDSGVEAMQALSSPKNLALFAKMKVLSTKEAEARTQVMLTHYAGR